MVHYPIPGSDHRYIFSPENIIGERESAADGGTESPPTNQTRSRMQMRVARATAMTQKRHGLLSVMKRSSSSLTRARMRGIHAITRWT